jgi:hypothetical protein
MAEIGYESWAFLPDDNAPTTGEPSSFNPPMITAMAIDGKTSLIFKFPSPIATLNIAVESTALSAEQPGEGFFYILTGSAPQQLKQLDHPKWELSYDGIYGVFSTQIRQCEQYLKLYYNQPQNIILSKVGFSTP